MINLLKFIPLPLCILLFAATAEAQDPVFTQAYLTPIYFNPGATGAGEHALRLSAIYRRHFLQVPSNIHFTALSADKYFQSINSSFGVLTTHSSEGYLTKTGYYVSAAHSWCGGRGTVAGNSAGPKYFLTLGLQYGRAKNNINYEKLIFSDQLTPEGISFLRTNADIPVNNGRFYNDWAAGAFFNLNIGEKSKALLGFAGHHINRPDESLIASADTFQTRLPAFYTASFMFTRSNDITNWTTSFGLFVYKQQKNNSFQAGFEITQNEIDISLGLWYRGGANFTNLNSFSLCATYNFAGSGNKKSSLRVGVAEDFIVGNKNGFSNTGGSSEVGILWDKSTYNEEENACRAEINPFICKTPQD